MLGSPDGIIKSMHKSAPLSFAVTAFLLVLGLITLAFSEDEVSVHFPEGARQISIPAEYVEGFPFFKVQVEGSSRPLWFTIDTGSSYTFLDKSVAALIGLKTDGTGSFHGAGGGQVDAMFAKNVVFAIGGFNTGGYNVYVSDLSSLPTQMKHPIDGFFGFDFLNKLVVTLDHDGGKVILHDPKQFRYAGEGAVLPITLGGTNHRWIYVLGTVKVKGIPPRQLEFFIDSGSGDAINTELIKKSTGKLTPTQTGVGLGSASTGVAGRVEWFRLGPFEIRDAPSLCCGGLEGTENMFGEAVLSRFVVTFDYSRKQMILEKGQHFGDPFN
jgi:Aspartyl protease